MAEAKPKGSVSLIGASKDDQRDNDAHSFPSNSGNVDSGSIDKVRNILFGAQMREYEKKFGQLHGLMDKEAAELREQTQKSIDSLEKYFKAEVDSLSGRLKAEQNERSDSVNALSKELRDAAGSFEKKLADLDDQINKHARDLRQQILDLSKQLSDDVRKKQDEALTALARTAQEIRFEKVDRANLADLFSEMSLRLTHDWTLDSAFDAECRSLSDSPST